VPPPANSAPQRANTRARPTGFTPGELSRLLLGRRAVRLPLQRSTVHPVTARDCVRLRGLAGTRDPQGGYGTPAGKAVRGIDENEVATAARGCRWAERSPAPGGWTGPGKVTTLIVGAFGKPSTEDATAPEAGGELLLPFAGAGRVARPARIRLVSRLSSPGPPR
jgi:hypothetical protein